MRLTLTLAVLGVSIVSAAWAQYPNQPQFRDPATGQIWTPDNVGGRSGPNTPQDRAFNPAGQAVPNPGSTVQTPNVTLMGTIPITAGPTVPIATIDNATLTAIPSQRWQVVLYLNNNSAGPISASIECRFTNSGSVVETVRANPPPVNGGQRVGLTIYGPPTNLFVDRAECRLLAPA
jgi:hypothetical protein